jgi:transposase
MVFTNDDKVAIKFLRQNKGYGAKRLMSEFPTKSWKLSGLKKLIKKIDETGSIERRPGAGRPRTARCDDNIEQVEQLALSQENKPGTHFTQREIARELNVSRSTVNRIVKRDLRLKCFKKHRATELTEANKAARSIRAGQLLRQYPASMVNFIVFTDEKLFTVARPTNSQNDRVYARDGTAKKQVLPARLLRTRPTFSRSVMVSVGVSALGRTSVHFVEPGVKVNGQYYRDVLLMEDLLPDIRQLSDYFIFQQDSAPAHRARETIDLLRRETPDFIAPTLWPPNSPDLNPIDYKIWSAMEEKVYKQRIRDVDELRQRILTAWDELDQRVIDNAVRQWRTRLRACVQAKGGHFEHTL